MKKLVFYFSIFFLTSNVFPQGADSLFYFINKEKPKFFIQLNNRGSFVQNMTANVSAILLGLSYSKRVKTGITVGVVTSKVYNNITLPNGNETKSLLQMWYAGIHLEYTYYKTKKIEISLPINFSSGLSNYKYYYQNKTYYTKNKLGIIYEASTTIIYKPISFIGLGAGLGYRLSFFNDQYLIKSFTSVIYNFELKIYFREIFGKTKE